MTIVVIFSKFLISTRVYRRLNLTKDQGKPLEDFTLTQMHIEIARNSTDDFNLFHDKNRWQVIHSNPFNGPIALGFQLGCFVEYQIKVARSKHHVEAEISLPYSSYEFTFAGVVRPQDTLSFDARDGRMSERDGVVSYANRILVKANGKAVIMGFKRESSESLIHPRDDVPFVSNWPPQPDRSFIGQSGYFYKRKFMIVGNAKNFLTSAFAQQSEYIDEFADEVHFPEMFPMSLISSALLERAQNLGHDLVRNPMIYASHKLCIDKRQLSKLKSNHALNLLVSPELKEEGPNASKVMHHCVGYTSDETPLFTAQIALLPLSAILSKP